ncbi:hypothetical protein HDU86_001818 [Geranomyces michiganensis]|nr:hypothetical protein HDU86_001818 [Geranomyces michiganensis]
MLWPPSALPLVSFRLLRDVRDSRADRVKDIAQKTERKHESHVRKNRIELAKAARAQVIELTGRAAPETQIVAPFFQHFHHGAHFRILFEFSPGLYAMHEICNVQSRRRCASNAGRLQEEVERSKSLKSRS